MPLSDAEKLGLAKRAAHKLMLQAQYYPECWASVGDRFEIVQFMEAFGEAAPAAGDMTPHEGHDDCEATIAVLARRLEAAGRSA